MSGVQWARGGEGREARSSTHHFLRRRLWTTQKPARSSTTPHPPTPTHSRPPPPTSTHPASPPTPHPPQPPHPPSPGRKRENHEACIEGRKRENHEACTDRPLTSKTCMHMRGTAPSWFQAFLTGLQTARKKLTVRLLGPKKSSMIDISMNLAATKECACRKSCDVQIKNDQPRTSTARTAQTSRILRKLLINLSQAQVPKQFHGLLYKDRPGPAMWQQCKWIQTQELKMQHPTRGKCQAAPGCPHIDGVLPEHVPMCLRISCEQCF